MADKNEQNISTPLGQDISTPLTPLVDSTQNETAETVATTVPSYISVNTHTNIDPNDNGKELFVWYIIQYILKSTNRA